MKKILFMIVALLLIAGCGGKEEPTEYTLSEEEYERLITLDGPMFGYRLSSNGLVCADDDYWCGNSYTVYYDGTIEKSIKYNISGTFTSTETIDKDDYIAIYEFCRNWMQSDLCGEYDYNGCECDSYGFYFCDEEGEQHSLYYTDNPSADPLKEMMEICGNYNRNIKVERIFNIFDYVDPSCPILFTVDFPEAEIDGFKCECIYNGDLYIGNDLNENLDWRVYILPEEPDEDDYITIEDEREPDLVDEGMIEVKKGDWIYIRGCYYLGDTESPDNAHLWGFYGRYDDNPVYDEEP